MDNLSHLSRLTWWKLLSCVWLFETPWTIQSMEFSGQNTGVGSGLVTKLRLTLMTPWTVACLSLLQGIFPTQGWNPGFPHCRRILYQLSHKGSPCLTIGHCYNWPCLLRFPSQKWLLLEYYVISSSRSNSNPLQDKNVTFKIRSKHAEKTQVNNELEALFLSSKLRLCRVIPKVNSKWRKDLTQAKIRDEMLWYMGVNQK